MPAARKPAAAAKQPAKEHLHVVMAVHPVHGTKIPIATFDDEESAWKHATKRNETHSHLAHHVKRVPKGG